jgi:ABC-type Na+ efflux pump permease subunit
MSTSLSEPRWYTIGPHGWYDLVRLARRGRTTLVRVGYLLALFAVLAVVYNRAHESIDQRRTVIGLFRESNEDRRIASINTNARIAEQFSIAILIMQNIAVLVLMPVYVASSVHEERDKRALPLLFTTHLTAGEIVRGKWLARVGHVGSILLAGLPVLSFAQLWGGIDMPMIAANFVNTACCLASLGAFSMLMAVQSRTVARSVVKIYAFLLGAGLLLLCCCIPIGVSPVLLLLPSPLIGPQGYEAMGVLVGCLVCIHGGLTWFFLWRAGAILDGQRGNDSPPLDVLEMDLDPTYQRIPERLPPIPDDALMWKERYLGRSILYVLPFFVAPYLVCLLSPNLLVWTLKQSVDEHSPGSARDFRAFSATAMEISFCVYSLLIVYRLAGCIVGERERQTLEPLLTLPITRLELLHVKITGALLRHWTWLLPLGVSWLTLMLMGFDIARTTLLLSLAMLVHLAFFAMLGLFLSIVCRSSVAAHVSLSIAILILVIGTTVAAWLDLWSESFVTIFNPVACWIAIWSNRPGPWAVQGLTIYGTLALMLWGMSCIRFAQRR